jgi:hypothetical protein
MTSGRALRLMVGIGAVAAIAGIAAITASRHGTSYRDINEGDCFLLDGPGNIDSVDVGDCDEVLGDAVPTRPGALVLRVVLLNPDDAEYPGNDAVDALVDTACAPFAVRADVLAVAPSRYAWENESGRGLCLAVTGGA